MSVVRTILIFSGRPNLRTNLRDNSQVDQRCGYMSSFKSGCSIAIDNRVETDLVQTPCLTVCYPLKLQSIAVECNITRCVICVERRNNKIICYEKERMKLTNVERMMKERKKIVLCSGICVRFVWHCCVVFNPLHLSGIMG